MTLVSDIVASAFHHEGGYPISSGQSIVPTGGADPCIVVAAWLGFIGYSSVGADHQMSSPWTNTGGNDPHVYAHHASCSGYVADGTPPSLGVTWTSGGGPYELAYAIAVTIPTIATAPVQHKVFVFGDPLTLDSAPGSGHIGVYFVMYESGGASSTPPTGYTLAYQNGGMGCYIRQHSGDTTTLPNPAVGAWGEVIYLEFDFPTSEPVADFDADPRSGEAPLSVAFTDLSTNIPTSWAWDFGDGGTSTAQDPTHNFTAPGVYTVCLIASNADGSDSVCKSAFVNVTLDVGFEETPPAGAIVEIYATEAGAARWDEATWDDDIWSQSGWQNVTPESVDVQILWGSSRPELGILTTPDAGSWAINFYDPSRRLDPGNADGPYFADLIPGLPVRVSHRSNVIRRGIAESIGHNWDENGDQQNGYIRVTDAISRMANSEVPPDTELSNTLFARAADAIAAADISVEMGSAPSFGDPVLADWVTGTKQSAWAWILDAAQQVQWIPFIDNQNRLQFRAWAGPMSRGRHLDAPTMVALSDVSSWNGLFSVVRVKQTADDGGAVIERALTPPPRYGNRVFDDRIDKPTPNAAEWAQAIIDDRSLPTLRWIPGTMYPLTARDVDYFATIEALELIGINNDFTDPAVAVDAIVVGGEIRITAKAASSAKWWFTFQTAQIAELPLAVSGSSPIEYLERTGGGEFLYRSV